MLSFRVHTIWSGRAAEPKYFHAVNVVLHAAAAACVSTVGAWFWPRRRRGLLRSAPRARVGLLAGLLFAVHPVHVEAVTGVVGRAELLCALCCKRLRGPVKPRACPLPCSRQMMCRAGSL